MNKESTLDHYIERTKFSDELHYLDGDWRYIPVHNFGETVFDAYCNFSNEMYFLQIMTKNSSINSKIGLYTRLNDWEPPAINLVAIIPTVNIDKVIVEHVMSLFASLILANSISISLKLAHVGEWSDC